MSRLTKKGSLGDLSKDVEFLSTGSWIIDHLIGDGSGTGAPGGIPRKQVTEIFGDESCGKTTVGLMLTKQVQDAGGRVVYVDHEHTLQVQAAYVKKLGIITDDPKKFILIEPSTYEDGNSDMALAILKLKPDLVVIDSLAAAVPKDAMNSDPADPTRMGLHAAITAQLMGKLPKWLKIGNTAMVILNQLRVRIKKDKFDHGPDEQTTGGNAIKFATCLRIEMKKQKVVRVEGVSNLTGAKEYSVTDQLVKVVIIKNKVDAPFKSAPIHIKFGKGIDGLHSLIELGINRKVITGEGWYSYASLTNPSFNWKLQGFNKVYQHLRDNPDVVNDMLPRLLPKVDVLEMKEAMKSGLADSEDFDEGSVDRLTALADGEELDEEALALLQELKESQDSITKESLSDREKYDL